MNNETVKATKKQRDFLAKVGSIGGQNTKKKLADDPDYYRKLGIKGAKKRWPSSTATTNA
jgi:general stress protein YciG